MANQMLSMKWTSFERSTNMTAVKIKRRTSSAKKKAFKATQDMGLLYLKIVGPRLKLPDLPVPHLINSNAPPSDEEADLVRLWIEQVKQELHSMKSTQSLRSIARKGSGSWTAAMNANISRTTEFIRMHEGIISPIRRIPPEVLGDILLWTASARVQFPGTVYGDTPWVLGQVCHSWRGTALALSALWAHIPTITLENPADTGGMLRQLEILKELLVRSKGAPIHVDIDDGFHTSNTHATLDLLAQHCERWHTFAFYGHYDLLTSLQNIKGRIPFLTTLSLQFRQSPEWSTINMFEEAPNLRNAHLSELDPRKVQLPYSQLTIFKQRTCSTPQFGQVVNSLASCIEKLAFVELSGTADPQLLSPLTLPNLTNLTLAFTHAVSPSILKNLTLPAIETLIVYALHGGVELGSVVAMLKNTSTCKLKNLTYRAPTTSESLSTLLELTPDLVTLVASIPRTSDIRALTLGFNGQPLAPHLETCEFYSDHTVIGQEICIALTALGKARCEISSSNDGLPEDVSDDIHHLEKFRIYCDTMQQSHDNLRYFHGWVQSASSDVLKALNNQLHEYIPELNIQLRPWQTLGSVWSTRVMKILAIIRDLQVDCLGDIYYSEIHFSLKKLSDNTLIRSNAVRDIAKSILLKWKPLFEADLLNWSWALEKRYGRVYIPQHHPIRNSDRRLEIIYGLDDKADIDWSRHIWSLGYRGRSGRATFLVT